jgi:8-oxo-dGTP pyrophosphatase MutT (NUDIX family)
MTLISRLSEALTRGHENSASILIGDNGVSDSVGETGDTVAAAVLVAITNRAEPGVILTQRPDTMRKHAGQIAFPGGRVDADDADHFAAALREAEEEVALPPSAVTLIGATDPYRTITGYRVTPVIGVIPPDLPMVANDSEVAAIFEAPLRFLLDPANHMIQNVDWNGIPRQYFEIMWQDRRIWGATAAMIVNLSRRLQWGN